MSAIRLRSLRSRVLVTVAVVAILGLIYGATSGARRSIHHAEATPAVSPAGGTAPPAIPRPSE